MKMTMQQLQQPLRHSSMNLSRATRRQFLAEFAGYPEHVAVFDNDVSLLSDTRMAAVPAHHNGHTLLSLAVVLGRADAVAALMTVVDSEAVVDFAHETALLHGSALQLAAEVAEWKIVELLLRPDPTRLLAVRLSANDDSLCHFAARNPDHAVMAGLLQLGAHFDLPNRRGSRPSHEAALNNNDAVLRLLIDAGCDLHATDRRGNLLTHFAARNPNHRVLAMLLDAGVSGTAKNDFDIAPLVVAVSCPNEALVHLLIAATVATPDLSVVDLINKHATLASACANPNEKVLDALLATGATFGAIDDDERTSACISASHNHNVAIMQRLIAAGCNVNVRNSFASTPLLGAAAYGSAAVVAAVLAAGADPHVVDVAKRNACHVAALNDTDGAAAIAALVAAGTDFRAMSIGAMQTPFQQALERRNLPVMHALLAAGLDATADVATFSRPALRVAMRSSHNESAAAATVRFLIRHGLRVRAADSGSGETLCHSATDATLMALIAAGADINAVDMEGYAVCHRARQEDLLTLAAAGADLETNDPCGFCVARDGRQNSSDFTAAVVIALYGRGDSDYRISPQMVDWMLHRFVARQWELLRLRGFEICVGLHALDLTALEMCEILAHAFAPCELLVPFHLQWALVTAVKHRKLT